MDKKYLLLLTTIIAFVIPLGLLIYWKVKTKCKLKPFIIGSICFIVFVNVLESLVHTYVLTINVKTSTFLYSNPIVYGMYGALMAGLFEEVGRYVGFKVLLTKENEKENSVAYGIGHGGIECVMTLGITYLLYTLVAFGVSLYDETTDTLLLQTIAQIDGSIIPLAIFERIVAICLHISLSVMVFKAVKEKGNIKYLFIAMLFHFLVDVPAGLFQAGLITSIIIVELLVTLITVIAVVLAVKTYKNLKEEKQNA